ncbi:MAG: hypothetical protein H7Y02_09355 [Candidatus Obscuribacterales bacterium]|nr:hypothetical protein [Steroidobacteraceae bacterium]
MPPIEFKAPWSRSLRLFTGVATLLLCLVVLGGLMSGTRLTLGWRLGLVGIPLIILVSAICTFIRGYAITEDEILIRQLGWTKHLPLRTLKSIDGKADAMERSIRIVANGGIFSFTGFFWNRQLKFYRAYASDPTRAVVLRYPNKTIVITPHDPQHFIVRTRTLMKIGQAWR